MAKAVVGQTAVRIGRLLVDRSSPRQDEDDLLELPCLAIVGGAGRDDRFVDVLGTPVEVPLQGVAVALHKREIERLHRASHFGVGAGEVGVVAVRLVGDLRRVGIPLR